MDNKKQKVVLAEKQVHQAPVQSESQKIWNEIKDMSISMFALPNQRISDYCKPVTVEPSKLYVLTKISSVLPALEAALGSGFVIELLDKYTVISRATAFPYKK